MLLITLFSDEYRYGFNGMEKDDEVKGNGNSYDFGARMHDPRIGRWLSVDALESRFPSWSPYNYALNNPIFIIDPDGNIPWPVPEKWINLKGKTVIRRLSSKFRPPHRKRHNGIDINLGSKDDDLGAPVYATHSGKVIAVKSYKDGDGGGNRIYIQSGDKQIQTWYMHLDGFADGIEVDQEIKEGQTIGYVGGSGKGSAKGVYDSTGKVIKGQAVHLHYEIRKKVDGKFTPIDPINPDTGEPYDPQVDLLGLTADQYSQSLPTKIDVTPQLTPEFSKVQEINLQIEVKKTTIEMLQGWLKEDSTTDFMKKTINKTIGGLNKEISDLESDKNDLNKK